MDLATIPSLTHVLLWQTVRSRDLGLILIEGGGGKGEFKLEDALSSSPAPSTRLRFTFNLRASRQVHLLI